LVVKIVEHQTVPALFKTVKRFHHDRRKIRHTHSRYRPRPPGKRRPRREGLNSGRYNCPHMKLIALYSVFEGEELLEGSVRQIRPYVDFVLCSIQTVSY